ncbi:MAG: tocopherol cyclase family protein [Prolixibacteraceae bacterium]|nr:tocopherol cyclase family protein [Prolixibacteraceae bacterium]
MIRNKLLSIFNPDQFQGWNRRKSYFEGWYFKVLNKDETNAFAIIPGIAIDDRGNGQAFIQVLDGKKQTARYHKFAIHEFSPSPDKFNIAIQHNNFSLQSIRLDLPELKGELHFSNPVPWPNRWYSPGIMGPYTFLPLMECYHGIVSMDHEITGQLEVDGDVLDFNNGRGYIEKDWGQSFPSAYIWMQSNHFSQQGISVKVSVAKIPYMGYSFVGFIAGIWLGDRLIQFTTYNQSSLRKSVIDPEKVELVMQNKNYTLEIQVRREKATTLASPILGLMDGRIEESMNAQIEVCLIDRKTGHAIFNDVGRNGGLEVAGKIEEIMIP